MENKPAMLAIYQTGLRRSDFASTILESYSGNAPLSSIWAKVKNGGALNPFEFESSTLTIVLQQ